MKIDKFEDLVAWQKARELTNMVYSLSRGFESGDLSLTRQMRRAAVSVMSNISEGFGRYTFNDSKQFFTVARGSLLELQSHLYIAKDQGYIKNKNFDDIYAQTINVSKLINGMIRNTKQQIVNARV